MPGLYSQCYLHNLTCFANKLGRSSSQCKRLLLDITKGVGLINKESKAELFPNHIELEGPLPLTEEYALNVDEVKFLSSDVGPFPKFKGDRVFNGGGALNCRRDLPLMNWEETCCCCSSELVEGHNNRCWTRFLATEWFSRVSFPSISLYWFYNDLHIYGLNGYENS